MVSAAKAFSKEPPKKPLTTPKRVADDFRWRYQDRNKTDQVVKFCAEAGQFHTAVRRAVESRDAAGKHHNHQSKVDINARRKFGAKIIKRKKQIKAVLSAAEARWAEEAEGDRQWLLSPFDHLHDLLDEIKPKGIGPVTVYDVATRIGAFLGVEPESVYLHAGVKQGLKALKPNDPELWRLKRVPMYMFPPAFQKLKADEVEDILCTYREVFVTWW